MPTKAVKSVSTTVRTVQATTKGIVKTVTTTTITPKKGKENKGRK